jgi:hypothetical protein
VCVCVCVCVFLCFFVSLWVFLCVFVLSCCVFLCVSVCFVCAFNFYAAQSENTLVFIVSCTKSKKIEILSQIRINQILDHEKKDRSRVISSSNGRFIGGSSLSLIVVVKNYLTKFLNFCVKDCCPPHLQSAASRVCGLVEAKRKYDTVSRRQWEGQRTL